jgi:hypothetical protein
MIAALGKSKKILWSRSKRRRQRETIVDQDDAKEKAFPKPILQNSGRVDHQSNTLRLCVSTTSASRQNPAAARATPSSLSSVDDALTNEGAPLKVASSCLSYNRTILQERSIFVRSPAAFPHVHSAVLNAPCARVYTSHYVPPACRSELSVDSREYCRSRKESHSMLSSHGFPADNTLNRVEDSGLVDHQAPAATCEPAIAHSKGLPQARMGQKESETLQPTTFYSHGMKVRLDLLSCLAMDTALHGVSCYSNSVRFVDSSLDCTTFI